jgi:hypothetical protein
MGDHIIDGEFQSDKYPTCPRGKVPLSVKDPTAQDLLWSYAKRRRSVDAEFADDLEAALLAAGYQPISINRDNFDADTLRNIRTLVADADFESYRSEIRLLDRLIADSTKGKP